MNVAGIESLAGLRREFQRDGYVVLPDFLRPTRLRFFWKTSASSSRSLCPTCLASTWFTKSANAYGKCT